MVLRLKQAAEIESERLSMTKTNTVEVTRKLLITRMMVRHHKGPQPCKLKLTPDR
jgi:hypothetical protein